jgi:hypothetical protein
VGYRHGGEPRLACLGPYLLFILALRDGGPHAIDLAVRPRSGRVTDSGSVVGLIRDRDQVYKAFQPPPFEGESMALRNPPPVNMLVRAFCDVLRQVHRHPILGLHCRGRPARCNHRGLYA